MTRNNHPFNKQRQNYQAGRVQPIEKRPSNQKSFSLPAIVSRRTPYSCCSLDVSQAQCHCCHRLASLCSCWLILSVLHGVKIIKGNSSHRFIKAVATPGDLSWPLHQHRIA
ncbi:hypothetical protein HAX54_018940 [Datura stramonium]|uniref:Uncharacterized protein n=1 Tax=Datura stramonium TaxID=4076 RepID=A0ABS8UPB6_DATST|nr:hypothetical protein [Datura stramonium]